MFQTLDTAMTRRESTDSPHPSRAAHDSQHEQMHRTIRCGQGRKMRRGARAKITPVLRGGKPKVFRTTVAQELAGEWEKPRIAAGPLNRNPMLGEHLMGSFGRLLGAMPARLVDLHYCPQVT